MKWTAVLYWAPRLLGLIAAGFLSLFAIDVFSERMGAWDTLAALAIHLIPAAVVLTVLAVAWRRPLTGGALFLLLGLAYLLLPGVASRPDWVATVAGPLWVIGALFLAGHTAGARQAGSSGRSQPAHGSGRPR